MNCLLPVSLVPPLEQQLYPLYYFVPRGINWATLLCFSSIAFTLLKPCSFSFSLLQHIPNIQCVKLDLKASCVPIVTVL